MNSLSQVIKNLNDGNSYCQLCSTQIKNKMLTAHINGKKHRDALKLTKSTKQIYKLSEKRKADVNENIIIKKNKMENVCIVDSNNDYSPTTPWQSKLSFSTSHGIINKEDETKHSNEDANMINKLPQGFFDEEKIGGKMKETTERKNQMAFEIDKFYKEVEDLDTQKEEQHYEMLELSAIQNDIELIDDQIRRWKSINELEKQKEAVIESASTISKFDQFTNIYSVEDDDDNIDIVGFNIDWRTKTI